VVAKGQDLVALKIRELAPTTVYRWSPIPLSPRSLHARSTWASRSRESSSRQWRSCWAFVYRVAAARRPLSYDNLLKQSPKYARPRRRRRGGAGRRDDDHPAAAVPAGPGDRGEHLAALSVVIATLYLPRALDFSAFLSLLLISTLFRLAINVSVTRLILCTATPAHVVAAFRQVRSSGRQRGRGPRRSS